MPKLAHVVPSGLLATLFFACSSSSNELPSPIAQLPFDAGTDAAPAPLPDDLPTCADTDEVVPPRDGTVVVVPDDVRVPIGWVVRNKAALAGNGRLYVATKLDFTANLNVGAGYSDDASQLDTPRLDERFRVDDALPLTASSTGKSLGSKQPELFESYQTRATFDKAKQVVWRAHAQRTTGQLFGFEQSQRPDADPIQNLDEYVWHTNAVSIFDVYVTFTFTKDSACHVRALKRIVHEDERYALSIPSLMGSSRASVERYLRERAPAAVAVTGALVTNLAQDALRDELSRGACSLADLSSCERFIEKASAAGREAFDTGSRGVLEESQFEPGGKLPPGYIQGDITTQGVLVR